MNILILGSGGREHTIAWKIAQSNNCRNLYVAPGNSGTAEIATNVPVSVTDFQAIKTVVLNNNISMVIVGPEDPLVFGIHDFFLDDEALKNVAVIGPQKAAAELEGSKEFAKEFLIKHNIPTAAYQSFNANTVEDGYAFLETLKPPYVLKADGLAAGKGVLIVEDLAEAQAALKNMLVDKQFGAASDTVVVEEFLDGIEFSVFALTDGENYVMLPEAKDYKRIGEGDTGLNTGGMGAVSPVPFYTEELRNKTIAQVVEPTIKGLKAQNLNFRGFVFFGLIVVNDNPYVIEYNVRMGDPETEVVIPRLDESLSELIRSAQDGTLTNRTAKAKPGYATTVFAVSGGYPESYAKGKQITLTKNSENLFHAGTKNEDGMLITNGGRVLAATCFGNSMSEALAASYEQIKDVHFEGMTFRTDIGKDLIKYV